MNDRQPVGIGEDAKGVEIAGPVREGSRQTHGQEPRIGTEVSIWVATPLDSEKLRGMFSRTSSETIYRRFHLPYPEVPEWMLALMLGANHHKETLVAVTEEKVVGHAMYVRLGDGTEAEIAIIVEDEWQSKGVGKSLLSELAQRARLRGVETFTGEVLATNRPMLGLAAMFAGTDYAMADDVCHVRMPLQTPGSTPYTARTDRLGLHKDWITTHDKHARQTREEKSYIKGSAFPGYGTLRNEPGSNPTREHRK